MLTQCFSRSFRNIMILVATAVAGVAVINVATSESRATYEVAASQSRPSTSKANCDAKAGKLMRLMEATAPVIQ